MASKKRDGGGSNFGLIITLVFFVLSTVILGITTYLSYAELEKKEKDKADAEKKAKDAQTERDWYRFKSNVLGTTVGGVKPVGRSAAELALEKKQLDEGTLTFKDVVPDDKGFKDQVKDFAKIGVKWQGTDLPSDTFQSVIAKKEQENAALGKMLADARRQQQEEKARADQARDDADKQKKTFAAEIDALKKQRSVDLVSVSETNVRLQKELDEANKTKNDVLTREADYKTSLEKLDRDKKRADAELKQARNDAAVAREERNEMREKLLIVKSQFGVDDKTLEAQQLDRNAVEALKTWDKNWRIVDMDKTGTRPYINLGTSDRIQPQITFSVHEMGKDGKLNPIPKGTVEVVQARGPKLSVVAVTSVKDAKANPLMKGDYLFNPTWDPYQKVKIALAGVVDLNQERADGTAEFMRMLRRQNVEIDAAIDVSDEKAPKMTGGGITSRTKYVIVADSLDDINHNKARDTVYRGAYDALVKQMREKATANAVPVISLSKYLEMIGYRSPKVSGRSVSR
jgi:hypothetical protein